MGLGDAIKLFKGNRTSGVPSSVKRLPAEPAGTPPNLSLGSIYESFVYQRENSVEQKKKRERGIFHPSSGLHEKSGLCPRSLIFELLCSPLSRTNIPSRLVRVLEAGTGRHTSMQATWRDIAEAGHMGIVKAEPEVHCVHHVLPLKGHMDILLTTNAGWRYAVDIKTWSSNNCAKTFEPEWKHRVQLNTYMGMAGVKVGYMIYENKDSNVWLGPDEKFRIPFSKTLYEETEEFCKDILRLVVNQDMPEFSESVCKANVMFCPYKEVCTAEKEGTTSWPKFDRRPGALKKRHLAIFEEP
jgi:CRISPR/Cas system-associated exonuclease Cas4 (RecB family)